MRNISTSLKAVYQYLWRFQIYLIFGNVGNALLYQDKHVSRFIFNPDWAIILPWLLGGIVRSIRNPRIKYRLDPSTGKEAAIFMAGSLVVYTSVWLEVNRGAIERQLPSLGIIWVIGLLILLARPRYPASSFAHKKQI